MQTTSAGGRAVLVDFGIASRDFDPVQAIYGTAGYTAPEAGRGAAPSVAADVFSLAATAFALLTGSPPSTGRRVEWTESQVTAQRPSR